jgi:hypothetical protein
MMRRALALAALAALAGGAVAVLAVVAAAHTARYESTVTIHFQRGQGAQSDTFSGRVSSVKARCERKRQVNVRRRLEGPDLLVGMAITDRDGHWQLQTGPTAPGTYYAKAKRKYLKRTTSHTHVCKPDISDDLTVHHGNPKP